MSVFTVENFKEGAKIYTCEETLAFHTVAHHFNFRSTDCTNKLNSLLLSTSKIASIS